MPRLEGASDARRHVDVSSNEARWRTFTDDLVKDLRFALRGLGRNPGFTIAAAITIAIGIGATTTVVSIANAVLLRPPPHVFEPHRLVSIWEERSGNRHHGLEGRRLPYARYQAYQKATRDVFSGLAAHNYVSISFRAGDEAEALSAVLASGNYFEVLGVTPLAGRLFTGDHDPDVVLSAALWRQRFGGNPSVIGRTIYIDSRAFVVGGVAPEGFSGTTWGVGVDLWVPGVAFRERMEADLGFDPSDVVVATIDVGSHGYDRERGRAFYEQLVERLRARPDVVSAALARFVLLGGGDASTPVRAASDASGTTRTTAGYSISDTAYFSTLGFELLAGRAFTASDRSSSPGVAIVNEALAERLWPGENAIGQRFLRGRRDEPVEVIGVVRDGKYVLVTEERAPFFFLPFAQAYTSTMALHVRTTPGSDGILDHIRREVRAFRPAARPGSTHSRRFDRSSRVLERARPVSGPAPLSSAAGGPA